MFEKIDDVTIHEWMDFYWFNIPDKITHCLTKEIKEDLRHIKDKETKPFAIYKTNGSIKELENTTHSIEAVEYLNKQGLDIYLTEPLCGYLEGAHIPSHGTKHNMWFYTEFRMWEDLSKIRADELDSIAEYAERNSLTNITVHTCDYNVEKYFSYHYPSLKLICDDLFLKTSHDIFFVREVKQPRFTKKFINFNWRYARHRHMIAAYLSNLSSNVSWPFKCKFEHLERTLYFSFEEFVKDYPRQANSLRAGVDRLYDCSPLSLDIKIDEVSEFQHHYFFDMWPKTSKVQKGVSPNINRSRALLSKYYRDCFCDVITETRFAQPTGNYSEKVYQAMFFLKPFILVAPPFTLEYLKSHGYKTFEEFWDESYDTETHHGFRLAKIFKVIDKINAMSIEELKKLYIQMTPILKHNRDLAYERLLKCKFLYLDAAMRPDPK